ncbi:MAG TPA: tetratricopeptide repeat-containing protein [Thermoleophilaceae bacterium]
MIYAFTGRRSPSLSDDAQSRVERRVAKLLRQSKPSVVLGAAACGSDLAILAEALRLRATHGAPRVRVMLPTPVERFRADSVEEAWQPRFDDVIGQVRGHGELIELDGEVEDPYAAGNEAILDDALETAGQLGERALALVVASPGEGEYAQRFVEQAALRGMRELRIDPAVTRAEQRRCFVVMPYGRKWDAQRGFKMDCDLTYGKLLVPALEHAQLDYRRADETVDPGVVLQPMIDDLAHADLVVADLATGNFNVGWELGLRHLFKDHSTILIKPAGNVPAPFDVQALRAVSYDHDRDGFSDEAALSAWERLEPLLAPGAYKTKSDSPVRAFGTAELAQIEPGGPEAREVQDLRDALADARDLRDPDRVEAVLERAADLPSDGAALLTAEAGVIMVRLGRHERARDLLEPIVQNDPEARRPAAYQFLAMSLYQPRQASDEDLRRAEEILRALQRRGGYPETNSLLGAVAKRRARRLEGPERVKELRAALSSYSAEYEDNLSDFYAGVNVLAVGVVLALAHDDADARNHVERLLPVVEVAGELALRNAPGDYWARVSLAETTLVAELVGRGGGDATVVDAYRHAGQVGPLPRDLASATDQLEWYEAMGIQHPLLAAAAEAVRSS